MAKFKEMRLKICKLSKVFKVKCAITMSEIIFHEKNNSMSFYSFLFAQKKLSQLVLFRPKQKFLNNQSLMLTNILLLSLKIRVSSWSNYARRSNCKIAANLYPINEKSLWATILINTMLYSNLTQSKKHIPIKRNYLL